VGAAGVDGGPPGPRPLDVASGLPRASSAPARGRATVARNAPRRIRPATTGRRRPAIDPGAGLAAPSPFARRSTARRPGEVAGGEVPPAAPRAGR